MDGRVDLQSLKFDVDQIEQDVQDVIKKHYKKTMLTNVSMVSEETLGNEQGFYLIFIKRDGLEDRHLSVTSFGSDVRFEEIIESVSGLVSDMMTGGDNRKVGQS